MSNVVIGLFGSFRVGIARRTGCRSVTGRRLAQDALGGGAVHAVLCSGSADPTRPAKARPPGVSATRSVTVAESKRASTNTSLMTARWQPLQQACIGLGELARKALSSLSNDTYSQEVTAAPRAHRLGGSVAGRRAWRSKVEGGNVRGDTFGLRRQGPCGVRDAQARPRSALGARTLHGAGRGLGDPEALSRAPVVRRSSAPRRAPSPSVEVARELEGP